MYTAGVVLGTAFQAVQSGDCGLDDRELVVRFPTGENIYLFSETSRPTVGSNQPLLQGLLTLFYDMDCFWRVWWNLWAPPQKNVFQSVK